MKNAFYLLLIGILALPLTVAAQEEPVKLEEPKNIDDETFDTFKSSAFRLYNKTLELKLRVDNKEVFTKDDRTELDSMNVELSSLQKQGSGLVGAAKKLRPLKKVKTGVQSAKTAIEAVKVSLQNVTYVVSNMKTEEEEE